MSSTDRDANRPLLHPSRRRGNEDTSQRLSQGAAGDSVPDPRHQRRAAIHIIRRRRQGVAKKAPLTPSPARAGCAATRGTRGRSNKDIARRLTTKERIAKKHLKAILTKPDGISRTEAVAVAGKRGMIPLGPRSRARLISVSTMCFPGGKFPTEKCRINETWLVRRGTGNYLASQ
jgi:hypothetical protein